MLAPLLAIVPVLLIIALGFGLKRGGFPNDAFWRPAARMVYFIFLPALLLRVIALANLDLSLWRAQAATVSAILLITSVLLLSRKPLGLAGPAFTSVVQGSIRHNTYIGLAIGAIVLSTDQLAAFALIVAVIVPLVNAISVATLGHFGANAEAAATTPRAVAKLVGTNPLIVACIAGAVLNLTGVGLPYGSGEIVGMLAQPALPLGLLVVGAGLRIGALTDLSTSVVVPAAMRLIAYPLLAVTSGTLLGLDESHLPPLLLFASLPTAASAYILAVELGGDDELMARIITVETILCTVTIPLYLSFL